MASERTLLVTGGAGFIGSRFASQHLVRHPSDRVIVLDALTYAGSLERFPGEIRGSDRFEFVHGNVRNADLVASLLKRCTTVVHFAAETHVPRSLADSLLFFETDVLGTQALAGQAVAHAERLERFIHISSSEVYGSSVGGAMDEDHPLAPTTPYAAAKCGADRVVHSCVRTYGLPAVLVRPFNNFGPAQHLEKLIPRFITSAILGEPLTIHGDGTAARDWVFVDDTCDAIEAVLAAPAGDVVGEAFNVGTGVSTSVAELADLIVEMTGAAGARIVHGPERPGQVALHRACAEKISQRLGFSPTTVLRAGLESTVDWYRGNRDWWQRQLWMRAVPIADSEGSITYW